MAMNSLNGHQISSIKNEKTLASQPMWQRYYPHMVVIGGAAFIAAMIIIFVPGRFEQAEALFERGEYVSAFQDYLELAEKGDPRAQYALAMIYDRGLGPNIYDPDLAFLWFERAAVAGFAPAQYKMGEYYYDGVMVAEDLAKTGYWWGLAADQDYHQAWSRLINLYPMRSDVSYLGKRIWDEDLVAIRLREAGENGHGYALVLLGNFYLNGFGVRQDIAEAVSLIQKAADQQNSNGLFALGYFYQNEIGVAADPKRAEALYLAAAERGNPAAQFALASLYDAENGSLRDAEQALFWTYIATRHPFVGRESGAALTAKRTRAARAAMVADIRASAYAWQPAFPPPTAGATEFYGEG